MKRWAEIEQEVLQQAREQGYVAREAPPRFIFFGYKNGHGVYRGYSREEANKVSNVVEQTINTDYQEWSENQQKLNAMKAKAWKVALREEHSNISTGLFELCFLWVMEDHEGEGYDTTANAMDTYVTRALDAIMCGV